jgi:glycosyltransferase involved in cell wall biosynthesis
MPAGTLADLKRPLVSVGCAVYNGERTLARALAAVCAQDYENLEIIVSDDGSKDRSPEIYREFARKDPRIRIIQNAKNIGVTRNFNQLVHEARGEYFMWADQDDLRAPSFVSKTLAALEADKDAVLCHSHTGVFSGDPTDVKYIVTLHGVDREISPVRRYYRFLKYYSDTTISGLMRTDALRRTKLWRDDLGAGNSLLFELLMLGKFIEVPEVLYFYSARGIRNRPSVREEYQRVNPGKKMPLLYFPFLVVAKNQTEDIMRGPLPVIAKVEVGSVLWAHTSLVALTKFVWRGLSRPFELPEAFTRFCDNIVEPKAHLHFVDHADEDKWEFPSYWTLKGGG